MTDDAQAWLMGNSAKSATFPEAGTTYEGRILELRMVQQRDFVSKQPKFWPNDGSPMMQAAITIQTDARDDEQDDGKRVIYAKAQMRDAIRDAVTESGYDTTQSWVGGVLKVRYEKDGVSEQGLNPPKLYRAKFTPPAPGSADFDDLAEQYSDEPF